MTDHSLYAAEGFALTVLLGALGIWWFARAIAGARPNLRLQRPLLAAFFLRLFSAAILGLTSLGGSLRGGDEPGFIANAHYISGLPFSSGIWLQALTGKLHFIMSGNVTNVSGTLHVFLMALQVRLFDASDLAMRATMAAISVIGLGLIAAAVYELAGVRAASLTAWLLAVEPANVFFSTTLHKEPLLYFAEGMVAFGGSLVWRRARLAPIALMLAGCLIATATRPYAGWFLAAASALVLVHASLRAASSRTLHALALASVVAGVAIVSTPAIVHATSKQELVSQLQNSQNANASDTSSLKLGQVDFSSRGAIVRNLPGRMFDLMFRPFPWQLGDANQQLGVIETLFVLAALVLLVRSIARRTKPPLAVAGPLVYPAFMLLVAYSLAVGNAGTGFRYRTHIVALIIAIMVVLRARALVPTRRPAFARSGSLVATGVES